MIKLKPLIARLFMWPKRIRRALIQRGLKGRFKGRPVGDVFSEIYRTNVWGNSDSRSGNGSTMAVTAAVRAELPELLEALKCKVLLDIPCGDFNWMRHCDLKGIQYIGCDVVPEIIVSNQQFSSPARLFREANLLQGELPEADVVLCRDCLVHLSFEDAVTALRAIQSVEPTYIILTSYPDVREQGNIVTGQWRALNMELPPFNLPTPLMCIKEGELQKGLESKSLCVWRLTEVRLEG